MTKNEAIGRLEDVQLFTHLGQPFDGMHVVRTWKQAETFYLRRTWMDFVNEIDNRRTEIIFDAVGDKGAGWNDKVRAINPIVDQLVRRLTSRFQSGDIPAFAVDFLHVQIQSILLEAEHAGHTPPLFSIPVQLPLLEAGRFNCGWKGKRLREFWEGTSVDDLPDGEFVIY